MTFLIHDIHVIHIMLIHVQKYLRNDQKLLFCNTNFLTNPLEESYYSEKNNEKNMTKKIIRQISLVLKKQIGIFNVFAG